VLYIALEWESGLGGGGGGGGGWGGEEGGRTPLKSNNPNLKGGELVLKKPAENIDVGFSRKPAHAVAQSVVADKEVLDLLYRDGKNTGGYISISST